MSNNSFSRFLKNVFPFYKTLTKKIPSFPSKYPISAQNLHVYHKYLVFSKNTQFLLQTRKYYQKIRKSCQKHPISAEEKPIPAKNIKFVLEIPNSPEKPNSFQQYPNFSKSTHLLRKVFRTSQNAQLLPKIINYGQKLLNFARNNPILNTKYPIPAQKCFRFLKISGCHSPSQLRQFDRSIALTLFYSTSLKNCGNRK